MTLHPVIDRVTDRIRARSAESRAAYLARIARAGEEGPRRAHLSCGNQAHAYAAMPDKADLALTARPNLGIVTAYNDMLSAHQPYERFPDLIRRAADRLGLTARGYHRILRTARTIADLAGADDIAADHLAEAISYRLPFVPGG